MDPRTTVHVGDCRDSLRAMPAESIHCCVTSPPYWGLRDYGHDGQLGLEKTPEEYVAKMVEVFREVRRVLRDDGSCWVNLGDSYSAGKTGRDDSGADGHFGGPRISPSQRSAPQGFKPKDLVGIPWRVAFALQADGWYLRQDIIWSKPNPMPESVRDRCTKAHEYIFLLTKSARYFYDAEAVKEIGTGIAWNSAKSTLAANGVKNVILNTTGQRRTAGSNSHHEDVDRTGRNRRSVWTIATSPYKAAHFATFPPALVVPCVKAGTSEHGCCAACGAPWVRELSVRTSANKRSLGAKLSAASGDMLSSASARMGRGSGWRKDQQREVQTTGWRKSCQCDTDERVPCVVLDPFGGSGTTAGVANALGRSAVLCELNPAYAELVAERVDDVKRRLGKKPKKTRDSKNQKILFT